MAADPMRTVLVTGAGGFVGQALVCALAADHDVIATDQAGLDFAGLPNITALAGDLGDAALIARLTARPVDALVHLATVPGGAAEVDPALGAQINIAASMALIDAVAAHGNRPRLVFASSIAVFGEPLPACVDDATPVSPVLRYGAHKAMIEEWIAAMTRRGAVHGLSLRLPGIVARPRGPSGMKSAFMSNLFHDLKAGLPITLPVSPDATCWMVSRRCVTGHFLEALNVRDDPADFRLTLPALRVRMADLIAEVARQTGSDPALVTYAPDPAIEAAFGSQPPLFTARADALGFAHDGSLDDLVRNALANI